MIKEGVLHKEQIENSVHTLRKRIYRFDVPTGQHCDRVGDLAVKIAERAGMGHEDRFNIFNAGLIHDIGKTTESFRPILYKSGDLTDNDIKIIRGHAQEGSRIARLEGLDDIAPLIFQHHERVDGKGYHGFKGDGILPGASILTYADVFDALTSDRSYHKGKSRDDALSLMYENVGTQLNGAYWDAFEKSVI